MDNTKSARRSKAVIFYNGKNIAKDLADCQTSFSYTDNASGSSDSISVSIDDRDGRWGDAWLPTKEDTLSAKIIVENWTKDGETKSLQCGSFVLDDLSSSGGSSGDTLTVGAISAPADTGFTTTKNSATWENTTIKEIATTIAQRNKISVVYDARSINIAAIEQSEKEDSSFLLSLCDTYGLSLKIYAKKIVIFDREVYKAKAPVKTITKKQATSWSWNSSLLGTYTGGTLTYSNEDGDEFEITVGSGDRILKVNTEVANAFDAELKLNAALNKENHGSTTMTIEMMGDPELVAGQCVMLSGWGSKRDGKYYIDSVTHKVNTGYKCSYKLSRCEPSAAFGVISDAINKLCNFGILKDREWWLDNYSKIEYADQLIMSVASRVTHGPTQTIDRLDVALIKLWRSGVITLLKYLVIIRACANSKELTELVMKSASAL